MKEVLNFLSYCGGLLTIFAFATGIVMAFLIRRDIKKEEAISDLEYDWDDLE